VHVAHGLVQFAHVERGVRYVPSGQVEWQAPLNRMNSASQAVQAVGPALLHCWQVGSQSSQTLPSWNVPIGHDVTQAEVERSNRRPLATSQAVQLVLLPSVHEAHVLWHGRQWRSESTE